MIRRERPHEKAGAGAREPRALVGVTLLFAGALVACERSDPPAPVPPTARPAAPVASALPVSLVTRSAQTPAAERATGAATSPSYPPAWLGDENSARALTEKALERTDGPRLYAKTRYVWIRPFPDASTQWIGYLWHGGSVKLRSEKPVIGPGCEKFYAIEPRGYVCADGNRATLDPSDPVLRAIVPYSPDLTGAWPHRYAESLGAERYMTLPTRTEQRAREAGLEKHLEALLAARGGQASPAFEGIDFSPTGIAPITFPTLPRDLQIKRNVLKRRSTIAYTREADHDGRPWLLSADFAWMPKDRVTLYPPVSFHGVELGKGVELPVAFFRKRDRPRYRREKDGSFAETGKVFERLSWVALTGREETMNEVAYLETREPGLYVAKEDAVVLSPRAKTPWGADVGKEDTTEHRPRGRGTWLDVSVWGGYLIAYEGTRPVYATLISPGRGGTPVEGKNPVETASTPTGRFSITGKFATATMEAPNEFIHSDVPWTQNFSGPHALHGAYWHNDWGEPKSGGCVNVSPLDGRWLYEFTEPEVPKDWHAVRWNPRAEASTVLLIRQ
jgi:hypothetical protein